MRVARDQDVKREKGRAFGLIYHINEEIDSLLQDAFLMFFSENGLNPNSALMAMRILIGPVGALLLIGAILMAWFYPLTRERHARIRRLLARKKGRGKLR